jgi:hypothetical protein
LSKDIAKEAKDQNHGGLQHKSRRGTTFSVSQDISKDFVFRKNK